MNDTPDIIIQQTYAVDSHNIDMPMGCDYGDSRPGADGDEDSDWEEVEVENEAKKLVSQMKLAAGLGKHISKKGPRIKLPRKPQGNLGYSTFPGLS